MKTNEYFFATATFLMLLGICSSCQEQKHPGMLFICKFDFNELVKLGYKVVPQSADPDHANYYPRLRFPPSNNNSLNILIYTRGDTVSTIYCFEHDRLTYHSIDIHYHDTALFEKACKEWDKSNETFSALGALASDSNAILVRNNRTNRFVMVKKLLRDTVINISHPIERSSN